MTRIRRGSLLEESLAEVAEVVGYNNDGEGDEEVFGDDRKGFSLL